jgi:hypothetical protein
MKPPKKKSETTPAEPPAKIEIQLSTEQAARLANFARVLKVEKVGDVILALALDSVDKAAECWECFQDWPEKQHRVYILEGKAFDRAQYSGLTAPLEYGIAAFEEIYLPSPPADLAALFEPGGGISEIAKQAVDHRCAEISMQHLERAIES